MMPGISASPPSRTATSARIGSPPSPSTTVAPRNTRSPLLLVFYRRHMICIAATGRVEYYAALHASIRLIRREMDQPQSSDSTPGSLQAKGSETEPASAIRQKVGAGDLGGGTPRKPGARGAQRDKWLCSFLVLGGRCTP